MDIVQALSDRTDSLTIQRLLVKKGITVDRLAEKLKLAAGVAPRQAAKIEARADAIIAREPALEKKTDATFAPHEAILTSAESGLDALDASLRLMTNGGDPLPVSGSSSQPDTSHQG